MLRAQWPSWAGEEANSRWHRKRQLSLTDYSFARLWGLFR